MHFSLFCLSFLEMDSADLLPRSVWSLSCGEVAIGCSCVPSRSTLLGLPATLSVAICGASLGLGSSMRRS